VQTFLDLFALALGTKESEREQHMLRITKSIDENSSEVTLTLEGRLAAEWVALLESECLLYLNEISNIRLDFGNVTFVDDKGLSMLQRLAAMNVEIIDHCGLIIDSLQRQGEH
jgi:ABC-type transporter Mla MlaB component